MHRCLMKTTHECARAEQAAETKAGSERTSESKKTDEIANVCLGRTTHQQFARSKARAGPLASVLYRPSQAITLSQCDNIFVCAAFL